MDDIIPRLLALASKPAGFVLDPPPHPLCIEAAREIERLRNCGDMLEMAVRQGIGIDDALDKWSDARG